MTFIKLLREKTKPLHEEVGNKPYLVRYQQKEFALRDHYHHLCQLGRIYRALEEKMGAINYQKFNNEFGYLLNRYAEINKDIVFFDKNIDKTNDGYKICAATTNYVQYINSLDVNNDKDAQTIFGHFLARILGDLFGGQRVKNQVTNLCIREKICQLDEGEPTNGIKFYSFPKGTLTNLLRWLNANVPEKNIDNILEAANDAFKWHMPLFDELENTRTISAMQKDQTLIHNISRFFGNKDNQRKMAVVAVTTVATISAGVVLYNAVSEALQEKTPGLGL